MDFGPILQSARRAQAAYLEDDDQSRSAFEALGDNWVAQYQDSSHQAVVSTDADGKTYLTISGTRFSSGRLMDLACDVDIDPVQVGDGAAVTQGAYDGLAHVFDWAKSLAPDGAAFQLAGHSLGAWRCAYAPLFLPASQIGAIHCFESPRPANLAYWTKFSAELKDMVCVANGRDIFFAHPRLGEWCHRPGPVIWLGAIGFKIIDSSKWPGGLNFGDHSIDLVVQRLEKIAAASDFQPAA